MSRNIYQKSEKRAKMLTVSLSDFMYMYILIFLYFINIVIEFIGIKIAIKERKHSSYEFLGSLRSCVWKVSFRRSSMRELTFGLCSSFSVSLLPSCFLIFPFCFSVVPKSYITRTKLTLTTDVVKTVAGVCANSFLKSHF